MRWGILPWGKPRKAFLQFNFLVVPSVLDKLSLPSLLRYRWLYLLLAGFVDCLLYLLSFDFFTIGDSTGSRGDVFVVRTSKPVENLWKNGLFWSRYSFVTHSIDRKPRDWGLARSAYSIKYGYKIRPFFTRHFVPLSSFGRRPSVTLRVTFRASARIWLAVIEFQNGEQQSPSGSDKKRRNDRLQ